MGLKKEQGEKPQNLLQDFKEKRRVEIRLAGSGVERYSALASRVRKRGQARFFCHATLSIGMQQPSSIAVELI
jgi:hypothetical protein